MKNKKFKLFSIIFVLATIMVFLSGCKGTYLSSEFDEDKVEEKTNVVVTLLNNKDTEKIRDMSTIELRDALTDSVIGQVYEEIDKAGEFKQIKDIAISGSEDPKTDEEFAVVTAKAGYKKGDLIYTISFNKELKLAGLFYR